MYPTKKTSFPVILFQILDDPESVDIITWLPDGMAWCVLNSDAFSIKLAPRYFQNQTKFASFMRQVNGWGFKRLHTSRGSDSKMSRVYYHELFVRDRPDLVHQMSRQSQSVTTSDDYRRSGAYPYYLWRCGG